MTRYFPGRWLALCGLFPTALLLGADPSDDLTSALEAIRAAHGIPALTAAIVTPDGATQITATGFRKAGRPARVTTGDLWHLGSDTKVMTATLAGTFVAEGKLSWNAKLPALFPELASKIAPALRAVTLADLLTHRAGLIENLPWGEIAQQGGPLQKQRARAARTLITSPPAYPVGSFHYSNAGFVLVGAILERIGGKPWEELITERVFRPLGMKTAGFGGVGTPGRLDEPWGHTEDGRPVANNGPLADNPAVMGPAGIVHVSVADWAKFLADQLRGAAGKKALLPPAIYAAIQTPPPGETYAFGWGVERRPWAGGKVLTHNGSNTMNLAVCWLAPERQFGVLACSNQAGPEAGKACDEAVQLMIRRHAERLSAAAPTPAPASARAAVPPNPAAPNIVYILADDLGYGDLSCYNPKSKIPTPNLDRLAKEGVRFTDAHAPTAICTPTRYALLTGRYAWRSTLQRGVVGPWGAPIIAPDRLTIGEVLRRQGYATALIGKWHLGFDWPTKDGQPPRSGPRQPLSNVDFTKPITNGPVTRGFDTYFGVDIACYPPFCFIQDDRTVGSPSVPNTPNINRIGPMVPGWKFEEIMPTITRHAVDYIGNAAKATPRRPFFLFFSLTAPHYPVAPTAQFHGKSGAGNYGDFVMEIDWRVGEVLDAIHRAGLDDNTLVIFTSDNSPETTGEVRIGAYDRAEKYGHYSMGDLRGIKRDTWEGGHRVPFLARWPGKIKPDTVSAEPISQVDFFATAAALAGAKIPVTAAEDSFDVLPALLGQPHGGPVRPPLILSSGFGQLGVRAGKWMFIDAPSGDTNALLSGGRGGETAWFRQQRGYAADSQPGELYDLEKDPAEHRNLYAEQPEKVRELRAILEKAIADGRTTPGPKARNDVDVRPARNQAAESD